MRHKDGITRASRFVPPVAVVLVLLGGLDPAHADLLVSDFFFNARGVSVYTDSGSPIIPNPLANIGGGGGEGLTCLLTIAGVPVLFVANDGPTIQTYNAKTGALINANFATVTGAQFTALSLSPDGSTLYAAGNNFHLYAFDTTTPGAAPKAVTPASAAAFGHVWHDLTVDPLTGDVYATSETQANVGVDKFSADFTVFTPSFIAPPSVGDFAGLTFDKNGNLWVSNFDATLLTNGSQPGIYEYSGGLLTPFSSSLFNNPLGLAVGPPGDNDIYIANLSASTLVGQILRIDPSNGAVTTFISNAGLEPKYLEFTENCCVAATPEPSSIVLLGSVFLAVSGRAIARRRKQWKTGVRLQRTHAG